VLYGASRECWTELVGLLDGTSMDLDMEIAGSVMELVRSGGE
jgi:hypothetical protein